MVQQHGVKVTMVRHHDKQPYYEHKSEQTPTGGRRKSKIVYVEVISGERFAVIVEILPGFDFMSCSHLLVTACIDENLDSHWPIRADKVNDSMGVTSIEDRQVVWDQEERLIDGKWKNYGLTFAQLKIDEATKPTEKQILHDKKSQGRVSITVTRGTRVDCEPYVSQSIQKIGETPTASRDVVEKHHVSHTTKLIQMGECEPLLTTFRFNSPKGVVGAPIKFVFRGRSRESLQLLQIKPKFKISIGGA